MAAFEVSTEAAGPYPCPSDHPCLPLHVSLVAGAYELELPGLVDGSVTQPSWSAERVAVLRIPRVVDLPHPAFLDEGGHVVMAEAVTDI